MKATRLLAVIALCALAAVPAQATWTITSTSGSMRVITDGNWTLNLYNNYNGGDSVAYSANAGNSTELDLTGVYADTGRTITRIDNQGFKDKKDITKIILPDSCKVMWNNAFQGCTALETVGIPSTFTTFNSGNMFDGCSALKTIYFTDETPEIGTVHLPEAITDIKGLMFSGCSSIEKVIAPGVVSIGDRAFYNCSSLTTVEISPSLSTMTSSQNFRGCSALTTVYPAGTPPVVGTVLLPDTLTEISGWGAFFECKSIKHVIARGVTDVAHQSFRGCTSLVSVEFSPNLAYLRTNGTYSDNTPFYNCTSLTTFSPAVWGSVTIGVGTFRNCNSLTTYLDLSNSGITEIPSMWAAYTSLDGVTFPAGLTAFTGDQNFRELKKGAKFRFLGNRPTVTTTADKSPFYTKDKNNTSQRHVFIVDAATDPTWTNGTDFVAMADINSNNDTKNAFSASSADFPATKYPSEINSEDVLGATIWGSGSGRYNWLVQYVDRSSVSATWMNGDQEFSAATSVEIGDAPTAPEGTPAKASTAEFDYTFVGWNTDPDATTALDLAQLSLSTDTTFYAIYSAATRSYEITWKLDADTLIDTTMVAYGATPAHADVSKASDEDYSYTFDGWSTDGATVLASLPAVTGAATYIAVFTSHSLDTTVTVSWFDEDGSTALDPAQTTVEKNAQPTHAEPTKAATVDTTYTFAGWTQVGGDGTVYATANLPVVTADVSYKAVYSFATRQYTVTFADWNGTVLSATAYDYGTPAADVAVPTDPVRATTAEYSYTFAGWDATVAQVSADATYTATYTATPNEYAATFVDEIDDSVIAGPTTYAYGATVSAPAAPEHYGFTFSAWSPEVGAMPAANTTYTATYTTNSYTITFVNGDATTTASYPYLTAAADIVFPTPAKTSTSKASYSFVEWSPAAAQVTADATYTAVFTANVLSPMSIAYGGTTMGADGLSASIAATLSNYTAGDGTFDASVSADVLNTQATVIDTVDGTATVSAPNASASFSGLVGGRAYDWTLSATQNFASSIGSDTAAVHGRFYAKPTSSWFSGATFSGGAYQPAKSSEAGQQLRLNLTLDVPAALPRALPNASGAVVGIAPCQANAGSAPRFHAWNGAQWIALDGYDVTGGSTIALHGVIDFAISGGTMTWYADGQELTDANGNWAIPLSTSAKSLTRFAYTGDDADITSFSGNYDQGSVATVLLIY